MGIMAALTGHNLGVDAKMGFAEIFVSQLMALFTQLVDRLPKKGDLLGSMRQMTGSAVLGGGEMRLLGLEFGGHFLMTCQTHLGARSQQQLFLLGIMRAVTFTAFAIEQRGMLAAAFIQYLLYIGMAPETQFLLGQIRHAFVVAGMGIMTTHAVIIHKGRMTGFGILRTFNELVMTFFAQLHRRGDEQRRKSRAMGIVAGGAS